MINTNTILIAVDAGKDTTKYVWKNENGMQRGRFRTKIKTMENCGVDITGKTFKVEFEGREYLVGDMVDESNLSFDLTKQSIEHKIAIYVAIWNILLIEKCDRVKLAIGAPVNIYKNKKLKDSYREYIFNNGIVDITVNDRNIKFVIDDVLVLPEAIGPVYENINEYRNTRVNVIDIGGLNVNICRFNNLVPDLESMLVANKGANILKSKIADALTDEYGVIIYKSDVDQILKDDVLYINGKPQNDSKALIRKLMNEHLDDICNFAKQNELNIFDTNGKVAFCGAGSILLKDVIKEKYPHSVIINNAQDSNVIGFYKIISIKND